MRAKKSSVPGQAPAGRPRVRRGSEADAERLRDELVAAALALFIERGLEAVTMRAVATQVGVSAMTPYRYFEDKGHLLRGIWQHVMAAAVDAMRARTAGVEDARERIRAQVGAFVDYWETHPEHYRLVYMTEQTTRADEQGMFTAAPAYAAMVEASLDASRRLARAVGGDEANAKLASDIRIVMVSGWLQARLVNRRYPWGPAEVLRPALIELMLDAMVSCLREGPRKAPAPRRARAGASARTQ